MSEERKDRRALDDAAAAALWALAYAPVEHIGLLYEQDGRILATPTQTRNNASRTKGSFEIPASSLRGIFHNHPPPKKRRGSMFDVDVERASFSPDDILQAKRLGVPSYIAAGPKLRRFDPATGRTEDMLAQIPIDVILRHIASQNPLVAAILAERAVNPVEQAQRGNKPQPSAESVSRLIEQQPMSASPEEILQALSQLSHAELYLRRLQPGADQNLLAPLEHRAFAREFARERPVAASVSLPFAIPLYTLAKALGLTDARSRASLDEVIAGYQGLIEGLTQRREQRREEQLERSAQRKEGPTPKVSSDELRELPEFDPGRPQTIKPRRILANR